MAVLWYLPIIEGLAAFIGNMVSVNAGTPQASMEPLQFLVWEIKKLVSDLLVAIHNQCIAIPLYAKERVTRSWCHSGNIRQPSAN
jgi:hypothetical protein